MFAHYEIDPLYKLSTNRDIAREGLTEFTWLLNQLSSSAKKPFIGATITKPHHIKFVDVRRCVAGISAEIAFEDYFLSGFPQEAFAEAEQIINKAEHFFFYQKERTPEYNWEKYSLFNLLAVQQVAKNYPEYFPAEVVIDTRNWLQNNWQIWADGRGMNCIRYGLLSGFPLEAALKFSLNKEAKEKQAVRSEKTNLSYWGVNPEKDKQYIQQLDALFTQSGVETLGLADETCL